MPPDPGIPGVDPLHPGVYVHIPFCAQRCDYCAFTTYTDRAHLVDAYVDACITDVGRRVATGALVAASTVYLGGGTPSLVPADRLVELLAAVPRTAGAEVTVEANPDSLDAPTASVWAAGGVTRVSIGVQSTRAHVLAALGRTHDRANVARAIAAVRDAGIPSCNVDLITGVAGESADDFERTLDDVLAWDPDHVSVYGLMVEPGTPLARRVAAGELPAPDPDVQADRYAVADDRLRAAGLEPYEVSNWARPGHECRHNLGYWAAADCLAIGAAAHGHVDGRRSWNVPTPERYVERVAAGRSPEAGTETPDARTRTVERFGLALRTRWGAPIAAADRTRLGELVGEGLVEVRADRVVCTARGRLLASEVTLALWPPG